MNSEEAVLVKLLELAEEFSGQRASAEDRIYADLDINGSDFIEFVEAVERLYGVDLSRISPSDPRAEAEDPTVQALAEYVVAQRS